MVLIEPLVLVSIPDTINKSILSKILMIRNRYQVALGIELYISNFQKTAKKILSLKRVLNKHEIPLAFYLNELKEDDLNELISLNNIKPEYIAIQGLASGNSQDYISLCEATANILSGIGRQDTELVIKNSIYPNTGILSLDLLRISREAKCGVMVDTEALLHSINMIRKWSRLNKAAPSNKKERECYERYGFFVREGKILCPLRSLKDLTLEAQLSQMKAERYHISGSNTAITDKNMIEQSEIKDAPFHRYLVSRVMSMKPKFITVKSCTQKGIHNLDIAFRSAKTLFEHLNKKQIQEVIE